MAVMPITPITRKMAKKTTAITRTGMLHLESIVKLHDHRFRDRHHSIV